MKSLLRIRLFAVGLLLLGVVFGYLDFGSFLWANAPLQLPFRFGLDLQGGAHLVYRADTSSVQGVDVDEVMAGLRDVIERRVNFFGVTEPIVQVQKSGDEQRLIVELAGVFDINKAIQIIGQTPFLEFKVERPEDERKKLAEEFQKAIQENEVETLQRIGDPYYTQTELTGKYLKEAAVNFDPNTGRPGVSLQFNDEGAKIFQRLTKENIGKTIAIYLDGSPISTPVVQDEISGGRAQITGNFTPEEARDLVRNLNSGALPVPIEIISQQNIGAMLGASALEKSVRAGAYALIAVAVFLLVLYRLPGIAGVIALAFYTVFLLFVFKIFGVTLTTAGIAGFILSVGMSVDANILIFERLKEELRKGVDTHIASRVAFTNAWPSIRDANISTLITSTILFTFGTSIVKGFALTLFMGVFISMFSAFIVSRTFLLSFRMKSKKGQ